MVLQIQPHPSKPIPHRPMQLVVAVDGLRCRSRRRRASRSRMTVGVRLATNLTHATATLCDPHIQTLLVRRTPACHDTSSPDDTAASLRNTHKSPAIVRNPQFDDVTASYLTRTRSEDTLDIADCPCFRCCCRPPPRSCSSHSRCAHPD